MLHIYAIKQAVVAMFSVQQERKKWKTNDNHKKE